jgi:hypothetical protein
LDRLLEIEGMDLIQWVPGDGPYENEVWFELYRKVLDAGKHLQTTYDADYKDLDKCIAHFGTGKNIIRATTSVPASSRDLAYERLSRYGAL